MTKRRRRCDARPDVPPSSCMCLSRLTSCCRRCCDPIGDYASIDWSASILPSPLPVGTRWADQMDHEQSTPSPVVVLSQQQQQQQQPVSPSSPPPPPYEPIKTQRGASNAGTTDRPMFKNVADRGASKHVADRAASKNAAASSGTWRRDSGALNKSSKAAPPPPSNNNATHWRRQGARRQQRHV